MRAARLDDHIQHTNTTTTTKKHHAVYALGLYVDGPAAKRALAPYKGGGSAAAVKANQKLFDGVCVCARW